MVILMTKAFVWLTNPHFYATNTIIHPPNLFILFQVILVRHLPLLVNYISG